ncbi:hypothetical protein SteCoe_6662 [Stentor coeruleus]|uniref:Uncharacterized protein n=1 Tax=Stentor coeruleus TaxID=5963 RepID=A0A1R2CPK4_9CILI|nr:hypothetical protein SteCoe_6662 [Stentor coeruleus]
MSECKIEELIITEIFLESEFPIDLISQNPLLLSLVLGKADSLELSKDYLWGLLNAYSINNFSKAFIGIKLLDLIRKETQELQDKNRLLENQIIDDFIKISKEIKGILPNLTSLTSLISEAYSKCFNSLIKKFIFNQKILEIVLEGYYFKNDFEIECSIFKLSYDEIIKLYNWRIYQTDEILKVLRNGFEQIQTLSLKPGDSLSILVLVILSVCLKNKCCFSDVDYFENLILSFHFNFSNKQKSLLNQLYLSISQQTKRQPNMQVQEILDQSQYNYPAKCTSESLDSQTKSSLNRSSSNSNSPDSSFYKFPYSTNYENHQHTSAYYINQIYESDTDSFFQVRKGLENLFSQIRTCIRNNQKLNTNILSLSLLNLSFTSKLSLYKILWLYSYYEQYRSQETLIIWSLIKKSLFSHNIFTKPELLDLCYNIDYIIQGCKSNLYFYS